MRLIVGTRGSELAIIQTDIVIDKIRNLYPDIEIEKKIIITKGDKVLDRALDKIGDKGIFVSEIEKQILCGEIDFAVHSLKDMPTIISEGLLLTKTPNRANPADILVLNSKYNMNHDEIHDWLKNSKNIKIATGSKRRISQLLKINPGIEVPLIRGNINTRIKKMELEDFDGIVIAAAGIERLGLEKKLKIYYFDYDEMIPSPGQGALAIEIRENDSFLRKICDEIADLESDIGVIAERSFIKSIDGGCHMPVGAISEIDGDILRLRAMYGDSECKNIVSAKLEGKKVDAVEIGNELAKILYKKLHDKER